MKSATNISQKRDEEYPINQEAFDFLGRLSGASFDLTSSKAIFKAPETILEIMKESSDYEQFSGKSRGSKEVLDKCVEFFNRHGIECSQDNVSLNDHILAAILQTYSTLGLTREGTILVPTPTFGYYFSQFQEHRINFETLPTKKENGFLIDPVELEKSIVRVRPKALLLCYPNNPTGAVMTRENAEAIAEVVRRHDVFVISDEAFLENFLNEEKKHFSFAIAAPEKTLTITSMTKVMGLPIRTGFCVGPESSIKRFAKLGGYLNLDQRVIAAALENNEENQQYFFQSRQKYLSNIEIVKEKIRELNQKFCQVFREEKNGEDSYVKPYIADPDSTNVYLLDFSGLRGKTYQGKEFDCGLDAAKWMLQEASIGAVPGECFIFSPEEMLVRISLGHQPEILIQAFDNMINCAERISDSPSRSTSKPIAEKIVPNQEQNKSLRFSSCSIS